MIAKRNGDIMENNKNDKGVVKTKKKIVRQSY